MTRVTFFIGNGFDLNIGLKTRYKDFYDEYVSQNPDDTLAGEIGRDYEYWSDLEIGLGRYTEKVKDEEIDAFWASAEKLEKGLADYLESQMSRIWMTKERKRPVALKMQKALNAFYEDLPAEKRNYLEKYVCGTADEIRFSFVSFNYTNAFDLCLQAVKEMIPQDFGRHSVKDGKSYEHTLDEVIHIHGTTEKEMVLGVNDASQIANRKLTENPLYCEWLIKEEINQRFAQNKIQKVKELIDQSMVICVFGMSIGETDKMWWISICAWLLRDPDKRLIIYVKQDTGRSGRVTKYNLFSTENEVLEKLKDCTNLSDELWDKAAAQIYINFNSAIFDLDLGLH